jgi:Flagellar motor protein
MRKKKNKHHADEHFDETWLVPYSDLLTLLLALFIVLFASSIIDEGKLQTISRSFNIAFNNGLGFFNGSSYIELPEDISNMKLKDSNIKDRAKDVDENDVKSYLAKMIEQETRQLTELKDKLDSYIQDNGLSSQLETTLNSRQLLITFRDTALFDSASADLKPEAEKLARSIGEMLARYPEYEIMVSGHTDNVPINTARFPSNWELSAMRALNFMKILLESDISPERVSSVGYGEYRPIASNDTVEGRAANRRVEVSIVRNFLEQTLNEDYLTNS